MFSGHSETEELRRLVACGGLFVLTGAGLSTESGIPDYRRKDGSRRSVPMTYQQFLSGEAARRRYWVRSAVGWEHFHAARPNEGHHAVTTLQRRGSVTSIVTQNVDGLHARAGAHDVVELHGSLAQVRCVTCGAVRARGDYQRDLRTANPDLESPAELLADGDAVMTENAERAFVLVPCTSCGSTVMKPDVVMFGESVPAPVVADCFARVEAARAVLVLGSSLRVMSGYRFVLAALELGKPVALVGLGAMRGEDRADLVVRAPLGATLTRLIESL